MSAQQHNPTESAIERYGWAVKLVGASDDGLDGAFAYTVGLTDRGLPEFAIAGLSPNTMHAIVNELAERALAGADLDHGQQLDDILTDFDTVLVAGSAPFSRDGIWPGAALERSGKSIRLLQLVWPDRTRRFPWDEGYTLPPRLQPVLSAP